MDTLFIAAKHTHTLFVVLLILSQAAYFAIYKEPDFIRFYKKLGNLLLVQNILLGIVLFTGLLMLSVLKFQVWSPSVVLMIFVITGVLVHQILINRKRKSIRSDAIEEQRLYKSWVAKVYGAEILAEIVVFLIAVLV